MKKINKTRLKNVVIPFKVSPRLEKKINSGAKKYTQDNNRSEFIRNCVEYFLDDGSTEKEGEKSCH